MRAKFDTAIYEKRDHAAYMLDRPEAHNATNLRMHRIWKNW